VGQWRLSRRSHLRLRRYPSLQLVLLALSVLLVLLVLLVLWHR
jgi:hypothetical protein